MDNSFFTDKINIIIGGFGSGKSEYAINLALSLAEDNPNITLVDLDLVNAYFRSREAVDLLTKHNIKAIVPTGEIAFSDLPIAGPGVRELITSNLEGAAIFDVGGDDMGAIALSAYRQELNRAEKNVLMVINPFRPFTADLEQITIMKESIEYNSGVAVTALVSNPNLGAGTPADLILAKHLIVEQAARELNLPLVEIVIARETYAKQAETFSQLNLPLRLIDIFLSPTWLKEQQKEAYEEIVSS